MSLAPPLHSATMKSPTSRLSASVIITLILFALSAIALLYSERISFLSSASIFRLNSCSKRAAPTLYNYTRAEQKLNASKIDDRFDFDPDECNVADGKWVFNSSFEPLYSDRTCPYLEWQVSCVSNGRLDSDYRHWEWQPEDCNLPRFDPEVALKKLTGKRLLFVGDSLQRGQWESFVCMVESIIPEEKKSMNRTHSHSVFKAKEYNASIEFYWAPFLVESNSDGHEIVTDPKKRVIRVDKVENHGKNWTNVDILVFNTYVWWLSGPEVRTLWGSFANGDKGTEWLKTPLAYKIGLKTWANWVDSNIDPNKTRVFFTTMSPTHINADWGNKDGKRCFNETKPVEKKRFWSTGADKSMMKELTRVIKKMKTPISVLNITQLSDYRIDAHSSIWTERGGRLLTDEEKADPLNYADCIHWCLPGVPDTWNQIFLAHL